MLTQNKIIISLNQAGIRFRNASIAFIDTNDENIFIDQVLKIETQINEYTFLILPYHLQASFKSLEEWSS